MDFVEALFLHRAPLIRPLNFRLVTLFFKMPYMSNSTFKLMFYPDI